MKALIAAVLIGVLLSGCGVQPATPVAKVSAETPRPRATVFTVPMVMTAVPMHNSPTSTPTGSSVEVMVVGTVTNPTNGPSCRSVAWFINPNGALATTKDVAGLLRKLDADFQVSEGGQWSNSGFTVPAGSVFWTDLLQSTPPSYAERVRTQGNWGIYKTTQNFVVPDPNGGGRFVRVCEGVIDIPSSAVSQYATPAAAKPATPVYTCISRTEIGVIIGKADFVKEYNNFFEGRGFAFGGGLKPGEEIPTGSFFLGTFGSPLPDGAIDLKGGFLWEIIVGMQAPNGGRWMRICK